VARVTADTVETPTDRWVTALADPGYLFTADQVARMIQLDRECHDVLSYRSGFEAGYRARSAELNDQYRRDVIAAAEPSGLIQMIDRVDVRRRADRDARLPQPGDHVRGPVPEWPAERPDFDLPTPRFRPSAYPHRQEP
jgi:hypothetical protein